MSKIRKMSKQFPCAQCEALRDMELVERDETVNMKGIEITFKASVYRCLICGEELETADMLDANLKSAREVYSAFLSTAKGCEKLEECVEFKVGE